MRILHTSDWHLGATTGTTSRLEEQRRFLDWLIQLIVERHVDALVVAGDVFDSMQPSAEALAMYYRFLANLTDSGVSDVVIVGGNHDSPSRLDAPREVLAALDVHVVGGLPAGDDRLDDLVIPLRDRETGDVSAVCLAVPFVHEYRLGVRTTELDRTKMAEMFAKRFGQLYTTLTDRARTLHAAVPVIGTGHLVLNGVARESYNDEIHQVGFLGGLPTSVLDSRMAYAALGHIHHAGSVELGRGWYSGSPIPLSLNHDIRRAPCAVLLVDLPDDGEPRVSPVEVPVYRELVQIEGTPEELEHALRRIDSQAPLPSLVHVHAQLHAPAPGLRDRLLEVLDGLEASTRPVIVEFRESFMGEIHEGQEEMTPALEELDMVDVFARLCHGAGVTQIETMTRALNDLRTMGDEDFRTLVDNVGGGEETAS